MKAEDAAAIITVYGHTQRGCHFYCGHSRSTTGDYFQDSVNHLLSEHGCTLLHVGTDTSLDDQGKPWHSTVAVLASPTMLPDAPPSRFFVQQQPQE